MASPEHRLAAWRPWLAAAAAGLVLFASGAQLTGPMTSYAQGLPFIVLCACWLARATGQRSPGLAAMAAGVLLLAPAIGFRLTRVGIDVFEAGYLTPEVGLLRSLQMAAHTPRGTGPMLAAAAVGGAIGLGWGAAPMIGVGIGGAIGARISRLLLQAAGHAVQANNFPLASDFALWSTWSGMGAVLGGVIGLLWQRRSHRLAVGPELRRVPVLLSVVAILVGAWASTPPLTVLLAQLPPPPADLPVQHMPAGRSYTAPTLDPALLRDEESVRNQLAKWRFTEQRYDPWPCTGYPPFAWVEDDTNAVAVPLPSDAPVRALVQAMPALLRFGVYTLVLPGRAPPLPGAFGARARWSSVSFRIDRPPEGVRWIAADAHGWDVVEPAPWFASGPAVCAVIADPAMSIGQLTQLGHELSEPGGRAPCELNLALVIGEHIPAVPGPRQQGCAEVPPASQARSHD